MLGEEIPSTESQVKVDEEAPKINLAIERHLSEIAKKRDKHFVDTQNCLGTAIVSLSAAVSLAMNIDENIDYVQLMKYLWDTGKLLCEVYHDQSVARKSFITPVLDKAIKPTLDASISDEWLYGENLTDQIKDIKAIEKASASLKAPEKFPARKILPRPTFQGNWGNPPTRHGQVGQYAQKRFTNMKYKPKSTPSQSSQKPSNEKTRTGNRSIKK
ncbi:uncharacterized protein [Fopius arisanus]|uniref:Uncharacterized protein n=1 Tax=Fopius arisanus TaxID=64838 RepID=A0A9R1TQ00_9HYME|nr:PREDICTED: uncharacterized protein LOC105273048 [Fopius arisanus]